MRVAQVATSDGANMNVGTKLDAYVYHTLAAWYNEDMRAAGSNATLPAAPSGPQPPAPASSKQRFLGLVVDWSDPAFITARPRSEPPCLVSLRGAPVIAQRGGVDLADVHRTSHGSDH